LILVRKYFSLPKQDKAALRQAAPRILWVWALLPLLGIKRLQPGPKPAMAEAKEGADIELWERRAKAITRIAARLPNCKCLPRSLALARWMASEGLNPDLKLGYHTTRSGHGPHPELAHAWIELNGTPIGETKESLKGLMPLYWPVTLSGNCQLRTED
jgi:hypothetical protein